MFLSQLSLVIALATTEIWSEEAHEKFKLPDSVWVVVARFLCGTVLHFNLQSEMRQGLVVMKFSLNHHWKLKSASKAWLTGFAQTLMVIAVEGVNLVILCTNETVMDVVMNFLALVVIGLFLVRVARVGVVVAAVGAVPGVHDDGVQRVDAVFHVGGGGVFVLRQ